MPPRLSADGLQGVQRCPVALPLLQLCLVGHRISYKQQFELFKVYGA